MDSTERQRRVATIIHQYFRALEASDLEAVARESAHLCSAASWLLEDHLTRAPTWNSTERWIDGMIDSKVIDLPELTVQIEGKVVWGLSENPGGKQWSEPFWAELRAADSDLNLCEIRFGSPNDEASSEVELGFYPTLSAAGDGHELSDRPALRLIFRGGGTLNATEANQAVDTIRPAAASRKLDDN